MQVELDYGQAVEVAKGVLSSDYKALLEGLFQFDSVEEQWELMEAYKVVRRWYEGHDQLAEDWEAERVRNDKELRKCM